MKIKVIYILGIITLIDIIMCGNNWGGSIILWFFYGLYRLAIYERGDENVKK